MRYVLGMGTVDAQTWKVKTIRSCEPSPTFSSLKNTREYKTPSDIVYSVTKEGLPQIPQLWVHRVRAPNTS